MTALYSIIIRPMAKKIRALRPNRLSATTTLLAAAAREKKQSTLFVCRCPEAEEGEHECPAFDYLQSLKLLNNGSNK